MKQIIFGKYTHIIDRIIGVQPRVEQVIAGDNAPQAAAPAILEEPVLIAEPMAAAPAELAAEPIAPAMQFAPEAPEVEM